MRWVFLHCLLPYCLGWLSRTGLLVPVATVLNHLRVDLSCSLHYLVAHAHTLLTLIDFYLALLLLLEHLLHLLLV